MALRKKAMNLWNLIEERREESERAVDWDTQRRTGHTEERERERILHSRLGYRHRYIVAIIQVI